MLQDNHEKEQKNTNDDRRRIHRNFKILKGTLSGLRQFLAT